MLQERPNTPVSKISVMPLEEGIVELRLSDAQNENRLSEPLCREFITALRALRQDSTLKVLIVTGSPKVFCPGATQEILKELSTPPFRVQKQRSRSVSRLPVELVDFPLPVISALQGLAVGGGLMVALWCDMAVASESARYGLNFLDLGIPPDLGATTLLPALVGHHFASEMLFTAKFYKGRELKGRGLFVDVVPAAKVMKVALDIARRIAEKPRHVLQMLKESQSLRRSQALQAALKREDLMQEICFGRPETKALIETSYF